MSDQFEEQLASARWAVARWDDFPVRQIPRPLVLLGEPAHARNGYRSQRARRAFRNGWIETQVSVPEPVLAIAGRRPDRPENEPPIVITAARRTRIEQRTDRGPQRLPGWELSSEQTLGPIVVLDPEVLAQAWWPPDPQPPPPAGARPGHAPVSGVAVGDTLTYRFMGDQRALTAEVIESPRAVALVPRAEDDEPPTIPTLRRLTVTLDQPLGARVLVDGHGHPAEVTVR